MKGFKNKLFRLIQNNKNQLGCLRFSVLRVHLVKRILNVTTGLPIRIFSEGKLPKRTAIKEYLRPYRIERLVLKKNKKGTMYILNLSNYEEYDKLCQLQHDVVDGTPVTFRNMNLLGPPLKMSKTQIRKRRREFIENQLDSVDPDDGMDAEDYTGDVDIDDFNDEDLEDF